MKVVFIVMALILVGAYLYIHGKTLVVKDSKAGLLWQYDSGPMPMRYIDARNYCSQLELAGFKHFRLPTLHEARRLIKDCPASEYKGTCRGIKCDGCEYKPGQCYRLDAFGGECGRYWAVNAAFHFYGYLDYKDGSFKKTDTRAIYFVRCVKDI